MQFSRFAVAIATAAIATVAADICSDSCSTAFRACVTAGGYQRCNTTKDCAYRNAAEIQSVVCLSCYTRANQPCA